MDNDEQYKVYLRTDSAGHVLDINSSAFLADFEGWTLIDAGSGDRYHHAQGMYLDGPLADALGRPLWRWDGAALHPIVPEDAVAETVTVDDLCDGLVDLECRLILMDAERG